MSKSWITLRFLGSKDAGNNRGKSWSFINSINIKLFASHSTHLLAQKLISCLKRLPHMLNLSLFHAFSICERRREIGICFSYSFHEQFLALMSLFCFLITRCFEVQHTHMWKHKNPRKVKGCFSFCLILEMPWWTRHLCSQRNTALWHHRRCLSV